MRNSAGFLYTNDKAIAVSFDISSYQPVLTPVHSLDIFGTKYALS